MRVESEPHSADPCSFPSSVCPLAAVKARARTPPSTPDEPTNWLLPDADADLVCWAVIDQFAAATYRSERTLLRATCRNGLRAKNSSLPTLGP